MRTLCIRFVRATPRLLRAAGGATALEFALIAPVLLLMIFGTVEFGLAMYATNVLESATTNTARLGKTGFTGGNREATLRSVISDRAGSLLDMTKIVITTKAYSSFDRIGNAEPFQDTNHNGAWNAGEPYDDINGNGTRDSDMGREDYGNANDVVVYTVSYPWEVATPLIGDFFGTDGVYTITARAVVKNEPYNVGAP